MLRARIGRLLTSNAVIPAPPPLSIMKRPKVEDYFSEEDGLSGWPSAACILPVQKPYLATAMAANSMAAQNTKAKKQAGSSHDPLQASSSGVKKPRLRLNPPAKASRVGIEHMASEADKENQQPEEMDQDSDSEESEEDSQTVR